MQVCQICCAAFEGAGNQCPSCAAFATQSSLDKSLTIGEALDQEGRFTLRVGPKEVSIKAERGGFIIVIVDLEKKDEKPSGYMYRRRDIAIGRFEDHLRYFRRAYE